MHIKYYECVYSCLSYPACNVHAPYGLWSVVCPAVSYFSTLSHKGTVLWKEFVEHKTCVLIFSANLSETSLFIRRIQRDAIINVYWSSCKVTAILVKFRWNLIFFVDRVSKNTQISNLMKVHLVGAELFHADVRIDRQTDMAKIIIAFRSFVNTPNMCIKMLRTHRGNKPVN